MNYLSSKNHTCAIFTCHPRPTCALNAPPSPCLPTLSQHLQRPSWDLYCLPYSVPMSPERARFSWVRDRVMKVPSPIFRMGCSTSLL
ncbi:hypothetical protein E2C01_004126 [Portunus trituberculatus]|uniref:Uncharacterized protein n=1 Tax=Portunus trituberculatus TaxID=210409 RepID=A0A5B7CPT1_PORTR|nr:hypothetical protein [Portunus trituberculatus]